MVHGQQKPDTVKWTPSEGWFKSKSGHWYRGFKDDHGEWHRIKAMEDVHRSAGKIPKKKKLVHRAANQTNQP
jgi:hypothetical protein